MMRLPSLLWLLLLLWSSAAWSEPALFPCRVPYEPLAKRLEHAHQSPERIIKPRSARELLQLDDHVRYKFTLDGAGTLAIAPLPADAPANEYVHPVLAAGAPVATAGGITVEHAKKITRITLDQDSKAYCPSFASLALAAEALVRLGVARRSIALADRAPICATQ